MGCLRLLGFAFGATGAAGRGWRNSVFNEAAGRGWRTSVCSFRHWTAWAGRSWERAWGFFNPLLGLRYLLEPTLGHCVRWYGDNDLHMDVAMRHRDVDVKALCLLDDWVGLSWRGLDFLVRLPPCRKHLAMHEMLGATLEDGRWAPHITWRAWLACWRLTVSPSSTSHCARRPHAGIRASRHPPS